MYLKDIMEEDDRSGILAEGHYLDSDWDLTREKEEHNQIIRRSKKQQSDWKQFAVLLDLNRAGL